MSRFVSRGVLTFLFGLAVTASTHASNSWSSSPLGKMTLINSYASEYQSGRCPDGKYVVAVEIRAGTFVDGMRVDCAKLGPNGEHQELSQSPFWLGSSRGGNVGITRCPAGQVITAVRGRAGEFVDQVAFACRSWNATQGLHGSLRWQAARGGNGGEPVGPVECPGGMAVTGIWGRRSGSYVGYFGVECKTLPPTQPAPSASSGGSGSSGGGSSSGGSATSPGSGAATSPTVPRSTQIPTTGLRTSIAPVLKSLSSRQPAAGSVELTIDGERFAAGEITRVEVGGTAVSYRVVSPTRIVATMPQHVWTKINKNSVPIVITSSGQKISKQLPVR